MTASVIAWIVLAFGIVAMLIQRPCRNCQGCVWAIDGHCGHPTASQVPELSEIQMGMWRCPWRELADEEPQMRRGEGNVEDTNACDDVSWLIAVATKMAAALAEASIVLDQVRIDDAPILDVNIQEQAQKVFGQVLEALQAWEGEDDGHNQD